MLIGPNSQPLPTRLVPVGDIDMAVSEAGAGRPIVFIHGLGWDRNLWSHTAQRLSERYRVIAGDSRGHGDTDKPDGPYSIEMFASDWENLIEALQLGPVCLVGFSQGGMTAQILAARRPDLVTALCLVSTSGRSSPAARANMEARLEAQRSEGPELAAKVAAKSIFSPAWMEANPTALQNFITRRAAQDQRALEAATRALFDFDATALHGSLSMPTRVIAGEADALTSAQGMRDIAAAIPKADYVEVPGSGHMIPVEQPDAFVALLDEFLDRHFPPHR